MEDTIGELTLGAITERDRGRTFIYDTVTGERSEVLVTMLPQHLRKRRRDGSQVFTEIKPAFEPARGNLKCMLHIDDPDRKHYDTLGLPICGKSNLTAPFHVMRHMEKRHKMEWNIIQTDRKNAEEDTRKAERQEDREFQQKLMGKAAPLYVKGS